MADFELVGPTGEIAFRLRHGDVAVVGRGSKAQLTLVDASISRHHARIGSSDTGLAVEDLHSTNGTFLNGVGVEQASAHDGDVLRFGNVAFQVRLAGAVTRSARSAQQQERVDPNLLDRTSLRAVPVNLTSFGALLDAGRPPSPSEVPVAADRGERLARLELLLEISKSFSRNLSLDALLESIADVTCRIMNVHRLSILVVDPKSRQLTPLISRQGGQRVTDPLRLPASILRRVAQEKVAVRTDNAAADGRFDGPSIVLQNVCGAMCTPFLDSAGGLAGALYVDNLTAIGSYTDDDLDFLISFGGIAAAALENNRLGAALRDQAVALSNFERYFAPDLAAAIAGQREEVQLGGAKRPAAILFSDIRGFSTLSENMLPEAVVTMLNDYFSEMVDIVFEHGGTLDKFIGDSIMANWGAPVARVDDADQALRAAVEMQREMRTMNAKRGEGEPRFEIGIGINWGEVFVGNIGSPRRLEYTMIGDAVNIASRLCSSARAGEIIVSESLLEQLEQRPEVEPLEPVRLRGRATATASYRVRW